MPRSTMAFLGMFAFLGTLFLFFRSGGTVEIPVPFAETIETGRENPALRSSERVFSPPSPQNAVTARPPLQEPDTQPYEPQEEIEPGWLDFRGLTPEQEKELLSSMYPFSLPSPLETAETIYDDAWGEFISNMNLEHEEIVQETIIQWSHFNMELVTSWINEEISYRQWTDNMLYLEDLQAGLAPYMTREQLVDVAVNHAAYDEFLEWRREQRETETNC